jgi:hypothetical protein
MDALFGSGLNSSPRFVDVVTVGTCQRTDDRAISGPDFFGYLMDSRPISGRCSREARFDDVDAEAMELSSDFEFFFE